MLSRPLPRQPSSITELITTGAAELELSADDAGALDASALGEDPVDESVIDEATDEASADEGALDAGKELGGDEDDMGVLGELLPLPLPQAVKRTEIRERQKNVGSLRMVRVLVFLGLLLWSI